MGGREEREGSSRLWEGHEPSTSDSELEHWQVDREGRLAVAQALELGWVSRLDSFALVSWLCS